MSKKVVLAGACRTAIGTMGGQLSTVPAVELGSIVIKEALNRAGVAPEQVDYMEVKGRNLVNGLPDRVQVSANETIEAFSEVTAQIINAVLGVLETCPPELAADISQRGIILSGVYAS